MKRYSGEDRAQCGRAGKKRVEVIFRINSVLAKIAKCFLSPFNAHAM